MVDRYRQLSPARESPATNQTNFATFSAATVKSSLTSGAAAAAALPATMMSASTMQYPQDQGVASIGATSTTNSTTNAGATNDEAGATAAAAVDLELAGIAANAEGVGTDANAAENADGRVISPVQGQEGASQNHPTGDDFPSTYLCPFLFDEPPVRGVYFDVPGDDGRLSEQIFEYSRIYRFIATLGSLSQFRKVRHPINLQTVLRTEALDLVRPVPDEIHAILTAERVRRQLPVLDPKPVTLRLRSRCRQTMARVRNP